MGINWRYLGDALPAFVTIVAMPGTYSVAYGLIAGLMVYVLLNGSVWITEKVSGGRLRAVDGDLRVCDFPSAAFFTFSSASFSCPWFLLSLWSSVLCSPALVDSEQHRFALSHLPSELYLPQPQNPRTRTRS